MRLIRVALVLAVLATVGCSGKEPSGVGKTPGASVTPAVTASPGNSSQNGQNTSASNGAQSGQTTKNPVNSSSDRPGEIKVTETVSTSNAQPLTTMKVTPGVDRGWQNAATPEQIARGTWDPKPPKPVDRSTVQGLGDNGAPLIDDGIIAVQEG